MEATHRDPGNARIAVFGAGSIGCYVGGRLAAGGAAVTLIGRDRIGREIAEHGLHLTDWQGAQFDLAPGALRFATDAKAAAEAALVLVTVKSADTEEAGRTLAPVLGAGTLLVSFQNGLGNAACLKRHLPGQQRSRRHGAFQRGEPRTRCVSPGHRGRARSREECGADRVRGFAAGLPLVQHADLRPLQWAKLLLNLNNSVNALSGCR